MKFIGLDPGNSSGSVGVVAFYNRKEGANHGRIGVTAGSRPAPTPNHQSLRGGMMAGKRLSHRACDHCGAAYSPTAESHRFCSRGCSRRSRYQETRAPNPVLRCARCSDTFERTHSQQKYCSEECQKATERERANRRSRNGRGKGWSRGVYGERHHSWRGEEVGYHAFHARVRREKGKAERCERCGASGDDAWCEWANLTGRYEDPDDYVAMCRSCHRLYDNARRRSDDEATTCTF